MLLFLFLHSEFYLIFLGALLDSPRKDYTKEFMRTMQYYVTQFCVEARISRNCSNDLNRFFMSPLHGSIETKKYWKELK